MKMQVLSYVLWIDRAELTHITYITGLKKNVMLESISYICPLLCGQVC
jgi:hypothetical protein